MMFLVATMLPLDAFTADRWMAGAGPAFATTDSVARADGGGPQPIDEPLSIDGLPFDDDVAAWRAFLAYRMSPRFWIEGGYADCGSFASVPIGFAGEDVELSAETLYLAAVFRQPLTPSVYAVWSAGALHASFDVDGVLIPPALPTFPPLPAQIEFADPDDELGLTWSAGFGWRPKGPLSVELNYRRQDLEVINVEAVSLDFLWSFGS